MAEPLISVGIVNYHSVDFVELSLYSLGKLTQNPFRVIICDNGSGKAEIARLKKAAQSLPHVELLFRTQSHAGSLGHGEALNLLIDQFNTRFGVILDADAVFLLREWDRILIEELDQTTKIVGTPPVEGNLKPTDFPLMYAVLFETDTFKRLNIDMRPKDISKGQDTGWEMREKFSQAGFKAGVLNSYNTRNYKTGPFKACLCAEYYHPDYEQVFACHFGRGSTSGMAKYGPDGITRILGLNLLVNRVRGFQEKRKWLKICKMIIDKEAENGSSNL